MLGHGALREATLYDLKQREPDLFGLVSNRRRIDRLRAPVLMFAFNVQKNVLTHKEPPDSEQTLPAAEPRTGFIPNRGGSVVGRVRGEDFSVCRSPTAAESVSERRQFPPPPLGAELSSSLSCLSQRANLSMTQAAQRNGSNGSVSDGGSVLHNDLIEMVNTLRIMRASRLKQTQE